MMNSLMVISPASRQLMEAFCGGAPDANFPPVSTSCNGEFEASRADIVHWLTQVGHHDKKHRFLLESLRAALLEDLYHSLSGLSENLLEPSDPNADPMGYLKYFLLMIAGTIFAVCEGYDVITSLLNLFEGLPGLLVFTVGAAFSLLSIVLFYGFDLVEISKNLEVKLTKSPLLLDIFLKQIKHIDKIQCVLESKCFEQQSNEEWQMQRLVSGMLVARFNDLDEARGTYLRALNDPSLKLTKLITAIFAGMIFFGSGFFASQSLALGIAGLFMASATVTSLPVVALCSLVGMAAVGVYWFVERPGLENLVGGWYGLDRDDVNAFAEEVNVAIQKKKLKMLGAFAGRALDLQVRLGELTKQVNASLEPKIGEKKLTATGLEEDVQQATVSTSGFFAERKYAVIHQDARNHSFTSSVL